jgi:glycosyltransferase involved in cell wall biosynthesis
MSIPTVLHVIPSLGIGGAENMLALLVTAKRSRPIAHVVVDFFGGGDPANAIRGAGVPIHQLGLKHAVDAPMALLRMVRLVRQIRPAAIQSWLYYADLMSLWALELSGCRSTTRLYWGVRCSSIDQSQYSASLRWTIAACAKRANRPDAVVANSFAGRAAHRSLGYSPRAFPVIPNGVDLDRFRPDAASRVRIRNQLGVPEAKPLVIHVARVDPMKGHDVLLAVARTLPDIAFLSVGPGTQSLDAPSNVTKLGSRSDVPALYAAADLALSTSAFGEGFSNAIVEAMAAGVPVVATDVGDAKRIIGGTGEIVPSRNAPAMAAAIGRLVFEPEAQRRQRTIASRQRIETHYSLDRAVAAFDALHLDGTLPDDGVDEPGTG